MDEPFHQPLALGKLLALRKLPKLEILVPGMAKEDPQVTSYLFP